jgi:hypothetical protein
MRLLIGFKETNLMIGGNVTEFIRYRLTWKPDNESFRKEAYFSYLDMAETWYDEKLAEGKNPELWKEETTTIICKLK